MVRSVGLIDDVIECKLCTKQSLCMVPYSCKKEETIVIHGCNSEQETIFDYPWFQFKATDELFI
uniref:Uncharacterized protein n=1 Tax=Arundo donax TaxID=35708 RepID=A0A0A9AUE4_ARUDO